MPILPVYTKHIHPTWVSICYALLHPTSTGVSYKPDCATLSSRLYFFISRPLPFLLNLSFPLPPFPKATLWSRWMHSPRSSASSAYILTELTGTETFLLVPLTGFCPCCCVNHSVHMFFFKHLPQFSVSNCPPMPRCINCELHRGRSSLLPYQRQVGIPWTRMPCVTREVSNKTWSIKRLVWLIFWTPNVSNILYVFKAFSSKRTCISAIASNRK